jgi:hypothetical protein
MRRYKMKMDKNTIDKGLNKAKDRFIDIFKDDNNWNEKTIIGFMSFTVMVLTSFVDLGTGLMGQELLIKEFVYDAFVMITLGSFGIAGLEKFAPKPKSDDTEE